MAYSNDGQIIVTGGDDGKVGFHSRVPDNGGWCILFSSFLCVDRVVAPASIVVARSSFGTHTAGSAS